MATHSGILAWRIPWTWSLVGYSPWDPKHSDMSEPLTSAPHLIIYTFLSCYLGFISGELKWILFLGNIFGLLESFLNL